MFVGVASRKGPHVTPDLFVVVDGRIWSFTAVGALKVRTLRRRPRAGLMVQSGDDAVVMTADATVLDLARPFAALTSGVALDVPRVTAAFAARHTIELAGGAVDVASGRFGLVPDRWVLLCFEVDALAVVRGNEVVESYGWERSVEPPAAEPDDEDDAAAGGGEITVEFDELPAAVRDLPSRANAALGWTSGIGPAVLPARWSLATATASVPAPLFSIVGARTEDRVAVTFDEWVAPGPGGKRGVMLRGDGKATAAGDAVEVAVNVDRAVVWDGVETGSVAGIRDNSADPDHTAPISDPNKDPKKESRAG